MAAQVETRKSQPLALDTAMPDADDIDGSTLAQSSKTMEEIRPASQKLEVPVSPVDSGSDYSQADSRPVSMLVDEQNDQSSSDFSDEDDDEE